MLKIFFTVLFYLFFLFTTKSLLMAEELNYKISDISVFGKFEYGFVALLNHKSQWGQNNSEFNYTKNGGQDLLLPTWRVEAGMIKNQHHRFSFLYQPIFIETEIVLEDELHIDSILFEKNTNLLISYDFPFYRFSYWYLITEKKYANLWFGSGLQIRNANIKFRSRNETKAFRTSSLGPVPLINMMIENNLTKRINLHTSFSGFWAPIKYLNGGKTDVNGWIYEFEIQPRLMLEEGYQCFSGLRVLGGGAVGRSKKERISGGTYSKDVLLTSSLTIGLIKSM